MSVCICNEVSANDSRPTSLISILDRDLSALWDTGSAVSLVNHSVIGPHNLANLSDGPRSGLRLQSASGHDLKLTGHKVLPLMIDKKLYHHPCYLVENLGTNCILGIDFMNKYNVRIQTGSRSISVGDCNSVGTYLSKAITIPSRSEVAVEVVTDKELHESDVLINENYYIVPTSVSSVMPGVSRPNSKGRMKVVIGNPTELPVSLPTGTFLASARPLENAEIDKIDFSTIPTHLRQQFKDLLLEFKDVINDEASDIGKCTLLKQKIKLKDPNQIACTPPYRIPASITTCC